MNKLIYKIIYTNKKLNGGNLKKKLNIFYFSTAQWEYDFILKYIFNESYFSDFKINIILYDNNTDILDFEGYKEDKNIISVNSWLDHEKAKLIINKIKPVVIFFLTDEVFINENKWLELQKKTKLFLHQYNHNDNKYLSNSFQIPLGYSKHFLDRYNTKKFCPKKIIHRDFECSFIGSLKHDRQEMINCFDKKFDKKMFITGDNKWISPNKQKVHPSDILEIYDNSIFVLNGRGNSSLDCFRIYEAIVAGAIPVIAGSNDEIKDSFNYNNNSFKFITGDNWEQIATKCKKYILKPEKLQEIQDFNKIWWDNKINSIQSKIILSINDTNLLEEYEK